MIAAALLATAIAPAIPAPFLGRWAERSSACANGGHDMTDIEPHTVSEAEYAGAVRAVWVVRPGQVVVTDEDTDFEIRVTERLTLSADGRTLVWQVVRRDGRAVREPVFRMLRCAEAVR